MQRKRIFYCLLGYLCCGLLLSGCGDKTEGEKTVQTVVYQNEDYGYQIELPENWTVESGGDKTQIYALSPNGDLALNIVCELGGFNYYTPQDLALTIAEATTASFEDVSVILDREITDFPQSHRVAVNGKSAEGIHTVVDVSLLQPIEGIHYYLIISGGIDEYREFSAQWEKMLKSFSCTKTAEEMYQISLEQ